MAIQLSDNLKINVGAPIDSKYLNGFNAPYADVIEVNFTIPIAQRYVGLTVNILNEEYWYENGVADIDLVVKGAGGGSGSGERIERVTNQTSHGFTVGNIVTYSGGTYIKAIADGTQGGEVIGFVSEVNTVDQFVVVYAGFIDGISSLGLSPSTTYYLSTSVAGGLQSNYPATFGTVSKPVLVTFDVNSGLVYQYRGFVITSGSSGGGGSTSGITDITNIGLGGGEIYSSTLTGTTGQTAQLRTLIGSGNTSVTTSGDTVIILSSGATGIYNSDSPSNIEVGGVPVGTVLTGRTLEDIIEEMLVTVFYPSFVNPNNTIAFVPSIPATQEVGVTLATIDFEATFDRGLITPPYGTSGFRSGLPTGYTYTGTDLNFSVSSASLNDVQQISGYTILLGLQSWTNTVDYNAGEQPKDSEGNNFASPLPSGTTSVKTTSINGIYPWFYGKVSSGGAAAGVNRPTANQALINSGSGNTTVASSNGTIIVPDFTSTADDYIWFAIPSTSTSKTIWYVNALNNGSIGGSIPSGNLFPIFDTVSVNSPSALWAGVNYKIYISEVQSAATNMEFRNS